ncbi:MAG TPA: hypothetical protein VGE28_00285 [Pseudomonas sp.]
MAFLQVAYLATALRLPLLLMVLITPAEARLVAAALVAAPPMAPMAIGPTTADITIAMISCAATPNPDWLCLKLSCVSLTWRQGEMITVPNEQFE